MTPHTAMVYAAERGQGGRATWAPGGAFSRLLGELERAGLRVTGAGRQRRAQCPAHEDRNPSLSVTEGMSRVLVHCHAGCDTDDVLAALGLSRADLFDAPPERGEGDTWTPWSDRCPCQPVARYSYTDECGAVLYEVVRGAHKEFAQRRPDPSSLSRWRWSLGDTRRVLYRLPRILAAADAEVIWVAEGEKDVHALEAAGQTATCAPGGALTGEGRKRWQPEWSRALAGRDVLVVADKDAPGRVHAGHVLEALDGTARSAWIVEAAAGKDAADHLAAGFSITDFVWWS